MFGTNILYIERCNAIHRDGDDEYDDLYTGHPDREVRTSPPQQPHTSHINNVVMCVSRGGKTMVFILKK